MALAKSVEACPPIAAGDGSVVTACIKTRVASELVRVVMSDGTHLTGTKVHPVWSLDRNDWVSLGDLVEGENLATELGPISVSSLELYRTTEPVYNFETHGEHVYQVTNLGVLVHNKCAGLHHFAPRAWGSKLPYGSKLLTNFGPKSHTAIHNAFSAFVKSRFGQAFNAKSGKWWQANTTWQERYRALIDFHRNYQGGNYFSAFMKEIRDGIKAGQNPLGR